MGYIRLGGAASAFKKEVMEGDQPRRPRNQKADRHPSREVLKTNMVGRAGFEPAKSETADLQSAPFGHSGTYPRCVSAALSRRDGEHSRVAGVRKMNFEHFSTATVHLCMGLLILRPSPNPLPKGARAFVVGPGKSYGCVDFQGSAR